MYTRIAMRVHALYPSLLEHAATPIQSTQAQLQLQEKHVTGSEGSRSRVTRYSVIITFVDRYVDSGQPTHVTYAILVEYHSACSTPQNDSCDSLVHVISNTCTSVHTCMLWAISSLQYPWILQYILSNQAHGSH